LALDASLNDDMRIGGRRGGVVVGRAHAISSGCRDDRAVVRPGFPTRRPVIAALPPRCTLVPLDLSRHLYPQLTSPSG